MKKKIFTITLFLTFFGVFSQNLELNNFKIENNNLIWQKIYETHYTKTELIDHFKKSGKILDIEITENDLTGRLKNLDLDYKGFGKSEMSTAIYISRNFLSSFVLIEFKDGKYRVTLKDLKLAQKYSDALSNEGEISELKDYAVKSNNSDYKNGFKKEPSEILNFTFNKVFENIERKNDKW